MKKSLFTLIIALLFSATSFAQLTGVKNIPGDYPTVAAAIAALNSTGVGPGGVTFNLAQAYTETFATPGAGHITTLSGSVNSPIVFQKFPLGPNPVITAAAGTSSTSDAIIAIGGCDYVTFDGVDLKENPANTNSTTQMEWGYAILKASETNGSQHITIKNCTVTLNKDNTASTGIYSNNHTLASTTQLVVSNTAGANSYLKAYGITIANSYFGIYLNGFNDAASPYAYYDQNNEIGKDAANFITNVGGGDVVAYGIYTRYQNKLIVANTTVTSVTEGDKSIYGIYLTTALNGSYDLYGNTVTIQFSPTDLWGNANFYPVYCDMGASGTSNVANIYNNTVTNCTFPTSGASATTRCLFLLNMGVSANVYNNVVSNNTIGGDPAATTVGEIRYMWIQKVSTTAGPLIVHDNSVTGNSRSQPLIGGGNTYFLAIAGSGTTLNAYNNLVDNNILASNGSAQCLYITFTDAVSKNIYNNSVTNISGANGSTNCIYHANGTLGYYYNNKIQNVSSTVTGFATNLTGLYHSTGATTYYYNNMITDLRNPGSVSSLGYSYNTLSGIYVEAGGTVKGFYNNTVFLNSTTTSSTFGSSAFCAADLYGVDLRNNIFVNTSEAAGSDGRTVAIRSRNSSLASFTSNYNNIYAGAPGMFNLIFYNGTNAAQTLAAYKSLVNPQEMQSVSEMPPFMNVASQPYNIHLKNNVVTQCESGGVAVSVPLNIATDYDNEARFPNAGYPVNVAFSPNAPDIGADEFGGLGIDATAPSIIYTPLLQTSSTSARVLTAEITDGTGVPTSGAGLPVLYWKINSGSYQAAQGTWVSNNTFSFTFGGGVAVADVVSYYIVAQDIVSTPNAGAFPSAGAAGYTVNPPACSTPPINPSSYFIAQAISGVKHVGIGKDYATLTAAAAAVNSFVLSGPLTLILDDNTYPNETYPINFNSNPGSSATNTLTIKPNTGATPHLAGAVSGNALILLKGIDYVIVDGSNSGGTDKSLTIENSSSNNNSYVFGINDNGPSDPSTDIILKNCTFLGSNTEIVNETYDIVFSAVGGHHNCVIDNNTIARSKYGVQVFGSEANKNIDVSISNNIIGSVNPTDYITRYGIGIEQSVNPLIYGNDIMGPAQGTSLNTIYGLIFYNNNLNPKIYNNKIHDWYSTGMGSYGIKAQNEHPASVAEIYNNTIYNIKCNGMNPGPSNNNAYGIFIRFGGNMKIWHNTISLTGPWLAGSDSYGPSSACIGMYVQAGNYDIRDNILRNSMTNPNPGSAGSSGRAYGIQVTGDATNFSNLDYNDYQIDGFNGTIGLTWVSGFGNPVNYVTLPEWQAYTGRDSHSLNADPVFVSETDLHPTNPALNNAGTYLVPQDLTGAARNNPPDMGAYEIGFTITDFHTLAATAITQNSATLNGDINTKGEFVDVNFEYGLTTSYGNSGLAAPLNVRSENTLMPVNAAISGLTPNTLYHYRFIGDPTSSAQAMLYGADMTFTTLPLAPVVITTAATAISTSGATLNGTVNPNGVNATVTIEYGLTTAYGNTVAATPGTVSGVAATGVLASISGLTPYTTYHYRVVAANFNETVNGNDMTFTTLAQPSTVTTLAASNITVSAATLNGSVNANSASTDVTFEWGLTTAYGNTINAMPATVTGTSPTAVSVVLGGLSMATTYHYRCVGNGPGGIVYGQDMTFSTDCPTPAVPGTITGPASVCKNTTGVVYSVAPVSGATGYAWTLPAGATVVSGANTNSITVDFSASAVSGNISAAGINTCGTGTPTTQFITINDLPVPTVSGPVSICQNTTSNFYTTEAGMTAYVWNVTGGTITAGAGTNSITVTWNTAGTQSVSVNYANSNGCSAATPVSYPVTVLPVPVPTISGANVTCESSLYIDYTTEPGMTNYVWDMTPNSGTITQSTTNVTTIFWTSAGAKWVSVNYTGANGCAASAPTIYNVTVNPLPATPGAISGQPTVCAGNNAVAYSVTAVANAVTYVWSLPAGATIATGAGTNSITVNYGTSVTSGNISVLAQNSCGDGQASVLPVTVNTLPVTAGTINGQATVCQGSTGIVYSVAAITGATGYNWTVPAGATIVSGTNTNSITVDYSLTAASGNISVNGVNDCGSGTPALIAVTVNTKPATPVITQNVNILTSSATAGNQWYRDGNMIPGATSQTYTILEDGTYTSIVTLNGCSSDVSNSIVILHTGLADIDAQVVTVYPNPSNGAFWLTINSPVSVVFEMEVYNSFGASVYKTSNLEVSGSFKQYFDLQDLSAGMYTLILKSASQRIIKKIVITK
jgi:hypothetical protein